MQVLLELELKDIDERGKKLDEPKRPRAMQLDEQSKRRAMQSHEQSMSDLEQKRRFYRVLENDFSRLFARDYTPTLRDSLVVRHEAKVAGKPRRRPLRRPAAGAEGGAAAPVLTLPMGVAANGHFARLPLEEKPGLLPQLSAVSARPGDLLLAVNGVPVANRASGVRLLEEAAAAPRRFRFHEQTHEFLGSEVHLLVVRGGRTLTLRLLKVWDDPYDDHTRHLSPSKGCEWALLWRGWRHCAALLWRGCRRAMTHLTDKWPQPERAPPRGYPLLDGPTIDEAVRWGLSRGVRLRPMPVEVFRYEAEHQHQHREQASRTGKAGGDRETTSLVPVAPRHESATRQASGSEAANRMASLFAQREPPVVLGLRGFELTGRGCQSLMKDRFVSTLLVQERLWRPLLLRNTRISPRALDETLVQLQRGSRPLLVELPDRCSEKDLKCVQAVLCMADPSQPITFDLDKCTAGTLKRALRLLGVGSRSGNQTAKKLTVYPGDVIAHRKDDVKQAFKKTTTRSS